MRRATSVRTAVDQEHLRRLAPLRPQIPQRPATSRLAHIVVELRARLKVIGRGEGSRIEMPLTQEQIGEALGITAVHANRVIKQLRQDGVVELHRGRVTVLNAHKLLELADFDNRYLHQSPAL